MQQPLVSVIVPTKNSEQFIEQCLKSIKEQTYQNIEIIVVDNNSTDKTKEIALQYTDKVFNKGPERSSQRNYGAKVSNGEYVFFVDSDMVLSPYVVEECIKSGSDAVIVPEESFGTTFWAKCKRMEKECYTKFGGFDAARFINKEVFNKIGGYDERMIAGEDWDLHIRLSEVTKSIDKISSFIYHNEGDLRLIGTVKKKMYYGKNIKYYFDKHKKNARKQANPFRRVYFKNFQSCIKHPIIFVGMLFMKCCEFLGFGMGYWLAKRKNK